MGDVSAANERPQRGDVQTDEDGTRWIVVGMHHENGPHYSRPSRVREGSLAARVIFDTTRAPKSPS